MRRIAKITVYNRNTGRRNVSRLISISARTTMAMVTIAIAGAMMIGARTDLSLYRSRRGRMQQMVIRLICGISISMMKIITRRIRGKRMEKCPVEVLAADEEDGRPREDARPATRRMKIQMKTAM